MTGVGRRTFLTGAGLLGAGAAGAAIDQGVSGPSSTQKARTRAVAAVRPGGVHQVGIADRPAAHLILTAYDLKATGPAALRTTLQQWSKRAGDAATGDVTRGLAPSALTVTIGLGASGLRAAGLASKIPPHLAAIPAFPHDALEESKGGGDLMVQVCAEDPMVAAQAARTLTRAVAATAAPRWVQRGFRRTAAAADQPDGTPRNLMGQLDGTDNPSPGTALFDLAVWADTTSPAWMTGGSYLVARRIRMLLTRWDMIAAGAQEKIIGRTKLTGAPLSGGGEHTDPDFTARTEDGTLVIPSNSHLRLTHPQFNSGVRMLRRGYTYDDGLDATGVPDAGLLFLAFQADPRTAFVPIQRKLDSADALSPFVRHTASALFAVPPAAPRGGYVGQQLLEA